MDIFGFANSAELTTKVGILIKSGTDSLLLGPDWSKNLEICDIITNTKEGAFQATRAIMLRLQNSDENTVYLSMVIAETCMKNCGPRFAMSIDKPFMDILVTISKGGKNTKNGEQALLLIQQWGRAFESRRNVFPIFFDTFIAMKAKGFVFPKEEEQSSITFEVSNSKSSSQQAAATVGAEKTQSIENGSGVDEIQRLQMDLNVVADKITLCREMLLVSPGIHQDEALAEVIGFLEACGDRMSELIEAAGMQQQGSMMDEDMFARCFSINDALQQTLDAERTGTRLSVDFEGSSKKGAYNNNNSNYASSGSFQTQDGESKSQQHSYGNLLDIGMKGSSPVRVVEEGGSSNSDGFTKKSAFDDDLFGTSMQYSNATVEATTTSTINNYGSDPFIVAATATAYPVATAVAASNETEADDPFAGLSYMNSSTIVPAVAAQYQIPPPPPLSSSLNNNDFLFQSSPPAMRVPPAPVSSPAVPLHHTAPTTAAAMDTTNVNSADELDLFLANTNISDGIAATAAPISQNNSDAEFDAFFESLSK